MAKILQEEVSLQKMQGRTIYNPLETNFWKRKNLFTSKKKLGLSIKKKIYFVRCSRRY